MSSENFIKLMTLPFYDDMAINTRAEYEKVRELKREIESMVNVFGFKPEEIAEKINADVLGRTNNLLLCLYIVKYEAERERWVDLRNEKSNEVCKQISWTSEFKTLCDFYGVEFDAPENQSRFFSLLTKEIGGQMHRTNLQTFFRYVFFVLGTLNGPDKYANLAVRVHEILGDDDRFYLMPFI